MAGLYVHIPLCASRCFYCDFYSSTALQARASLVDAICKELQLRKDYLHGEVVHTIYLGGGTPSVLKSDELKNIFDAIQTNYVCDLDEVTIEANPDDVNDDFVMCLKQLPVNRVSMGVQSFYDDDLKRINRRHTANQAVEAVHRLQTAGYQNLSVDLIYGLPFQTAERWQYNIEMALSLQVPHISAYHLTYEEGTVLYRMMEEGKVSPITEDESVMFFKMLRHKLMEAGYEHYEISNFAKPGMHARHNSSYWDGTPYIGVGPSAHSFDGKNRQWNVADTPSYIVGIAAGKPDCEIEYLTETESYNDFVITSLRTAKGLDLQKLQTQFSSFYAQCLQSAQNSIKAGHLKIEDNCLRLTEEGILISDAIFVDLIE